MSNTPVCSQTIWGARVQSWPCPRKGVVERQGKWYCKQHDPELRIVRDAKEFEEQQAAQARGERIEQEGNRIAVALGIEASVHFIRGGSWRDSTDGVREYLVISFDELRKLLARLEAGKAGER